MNELKTLKELVEYTLSEEAGRDNGDLGEFTEDLRQEAIKWIKEIRRVMLDEDATSFPPNVGGVEVSSGEGINDSILIQEWIKRFFNITEEELK